MRPIRRRLDVFVLLAVVALLTAACGSGTPSPSASATASPTAASTPAPDPTESAAAGTTEPTDGADLPVNGRIEVASQGYAVTLPDNWFRIDMNSDELEDLLQTGADEMPEGMGDLLTGQVAQMAAAGISLFAFREADSEASFGTTVNILALPSFGMELDTLETLNVSQLKAILGADATIESERVELPIGDALKLSYDLPLQSGGIEVGTLQYLVATDTKQIILSCGSPDGVDAIADECEQMAESLELLP